MSCKISPKTATPTRSVIFIHYYNKKVIVVIVESLALYDQLLCTYTVTGTVVEHTLEWASYIISVDLKDCDFLSASIYC